MVIMPQLILLQKTIVNIEGVGRQLYPELDLWETARPQLERWMNERMGVRGLLRGTKQNLPHWLEKLPDLPNKAIDLIDRMRDGKFQMENNSKDLEHLRYEMRIYNRRTVFAVIGSGALLSSAIIYGLNGYSSIILNGVPLISWLSGLVGVFCLIFAFKD